MKKLRTHILLAGTLLLGSSCNDFLDVTPDARTEVNSLDKVAAVLTDAYSGGSPTFIAELSSDNYMDNGTIYKPYGLYEKAPYLWQDILTEDNDSPKNLWEYQYGAIAAANLALESLKTLNHPAEGKSYEAEALLCRAYAHFVLVNVFCMHYNPETADKDLGIPYAKELEKKPMVNYERGTVAEVYKQINADIEAALPYVTERSHGAVKYHFNPEAAYAFAAHFNLFYLKFDKAIEYATKALGNNPASKLRNYGTINSLNWSNVKEEWVSSSVPANFLVQTFISSFPYMHNYGSRYGHSRELASAETLVADGPWGGYRKMHLGKKILSASPQAVFYPKSMAFFEYTDKTAGIGFVRLVQSVFTADKTLLIRAEAYALKGEYDKATADLAAWMQSHCDADVPALTREKINDFYGKLPYSVVPTADFHKKTYKKHLEPMGFKVAEGEQENFIQCVLHFRRLETIHEGERWYDVKRYGIKIDHLVNDGETIVLERNDPRRAIQLPQDVIVKCLSVNLR